MAATAEGTFRLIDKASGTLDKITRSAAKTDTALTKLGEKLDLIENKLGNVGDRVDHVIERLQVLDRAKASPKIELQGAAKAIADLKAVQHELDVTGRKATSARVGSAVGGGGGGGSGGGGLADWFQGGKGGRGGLWAAGAALKGMASGIGKWVMLAPPAIGLVEDLSGAVVALGASATAAAGGGALIGGAGLAAFGSGLGSVALIGKTALSPLKAYTQAVDQLNKAMASGDPKQIQKAQQQVDMLAKKSPGIAKLSANVRGLKSEWQKLTKAGQHDFLNILSDSLAKVRKHLPLFAQEANRNTAVVRQAWRKNILTIFDTKTFDHFFRRINKDFRKSMDPATKGWRNFILGFMKLLKVASPEIVKMAHGFEAAGKHFNAWAGSSKGHKFVHDMISSFRTWWKLIKSTFNLLKALFGPARQSGDSLVVSLTKQFDKWTKWLQTHPKTVHKFFSDTAHDVKVIASGLADSAKSLWHIGGLVRPLLPLIGKLGSVLSGVPSIGGGGGAEDAALAFLGVKGFRAWRRAGGGKGGPGALGKGGLVDRLKNLATGAGGLTLTGIRGAGVGSTLNPLAVVVEGGKGIPGVPGADPRSRDPKGKGNPISRLLKKVGGPASVTGGGIGLGAGEAGTLALGGGELGLMGLGTAVAPIAGILALTLANNNNFTKKQINASAAARANYMNAGRTAPIGGSGPLAEHAKAFGSTVGGAMTAVKASLDTRALGANWGHALSALQGVANKHPVRPKVDTKPMKDLKSATDEAFTAITKTVQTKGGSMSRNWRSTGKSIQGAAKNAFDSVFNSTDKNMGNSRDSVKNNLDKMGNHFHDKLGNMEKTTNSIFAAIYAEMSKWLSKTVGQGTSAVGSAVTSAANSVAPGSKSPGGKKKNAHGGRIPGFGQSDTVMIAPGNAAAPGELIVNRHTEGRVNRILAQHGTTLGAEVAGEKVPHASMPADRFAKGGKLGGLSTAINTGVNAAASVSTGANLGGHPGNIVPALMKLISLVQGRFPNMAVTSTTSGGHVRGSDHYTGHAVDMAGPGMNAVASWIMGSGLYKQLKQGIHNPNLSVNAGNVVPSGFWGSEWGQHLDHIHLAVYNALSGAVGGGGMSFGGAAHQLKNRRLRGIGGAAGKFGQAAIDKLRAAAQKKLDAAGGGGGGGLAGFTGGGSSRANQILGHKMMLAAGWPESEWSALRALWQGESNWDNNSRNPSSGAYGIPQALGHGNVFGSNPADQIRWGLNYIRGRYGSPSRAYSAWLSRSPHWYQQGGRVPEFAGWHGNGLDATFHKPTYIGVGDKGTEHVKVTPSGKGGGGITVHKLVVHGSQDTKREVKAAFHELAHELDLQRVHIGS